MCMKLCAPAGRLRVTGCEHDCDRDHSKAPLSSRAIFKYKRSPRPVFQPHHGLPHDAISHRIQPSSGRTPSPRARAPEAPRVRFSDRSTVRSSTVSGKLRLHYFAGSQQHRDVPLTLSSATADQLAITSNPLTFRRSSRSCQNGPPECVSSRIAMLRIRERRFHATGDRCHPRKRQCTCSKSEKI
jgi:hypothetical protein